MYAQLDAGRREIKMLISSRADENEDMHRGGERGGRNARYVTPDLRYERGGAGEVGKMQYLADGMEKMNSRESASSRLYAHFDAGRRGIKMLTYSRADEHDGMHRGGEGGGRSARYVISDLRYERGGAGEVGKM